MNKKIILLSTMCLLIIVFTIFLFFLNQEDDYITGSANIQLSFDISKDSQLITTPKERDIQLYIYSVNFKEQKMSLVGSIYDDEDRYPFNIQGDFYQSHLNSNDILIDVNNQNSAIDHLDVVQWKLIKSADISDLNVDSSLLNQQAMILKFYHPEEESYFSFDIDLIDYYDGAFNGTALALSDDVNDLWHYKSMQSPQKPELDITSSDYNYRPSAFKTNTHNIVIEDESIYHHITIDVSIEGVQTLKSGEKLSTSIRIVDHQAFIKNDNEEALKPIEDGINSFALGHKTDPITILHNFKNSYGNDLYWFGSNFKSNQYIPNYLYSTYLKGANQFKKSFYDLTVTEIESALHTQTFLYFNDTLEQDQFIAEFYIPIYYKGDKQGFIIDTVIFNYETL
ncbi:hypothetical protein [Natranaerovirga hydrolytica]|nr:hypothetical protein [Natranaerovirga hydrolytica]